VLTSRVPLRVEFALSVLDVDPHHRVLEFGCGSGVAAAAVSARVTNGHVTAIDRSARAIARAVSTAPDVRFRHVELGDFTTEHGYDRVFGINVNLFWTGRADRESLAIRDALTPQGIAVLVYETPGTVRNEIVDKAVASLERASMRCEVVCGPDPSLVAIRALGVCTRARP
jgi:trans-aconitate methyltransferase